MPIFESPAVYVQSTLITIATYFIQHAYMKPLLDLHSTDANFVPLDKPTKAVYIRRDNDKRQTRINIFDDKGSKIYTIERESASTPTWSLFTYPQRRETATIRAGFFLKSFDFHNKPGLQHRILNAETSLSGRMKTFYLNDGYKYVWTRGSKYLERITNPGGNDEETRERIAKVRLMRQRKFDYEMILDETKVDFEVALTTAFLCMMTFWGLGDITETVGPTKLPDLKEEKEEEPKVVEKVIERIIERIVPMQVDEAVGKGKENVEIPNVTFVMDADSDADVIIEKV